MDSGMLPGLLEKTLMEEVIQALLPTVPVQEMSMEQMIILPGLLE